jgi:phosphoglycolate phosphatase-like HAD superfamily hydrolase
MAGEAREAPREKPDPFVWSIEVAGQFPLRGRFRYAIFDFDGTISLIREGWQQIMIPYFADELAACPAAQGRPREELAGAAREFIYLNTGKQTIYQCIRLAEEVARLGGKPLDPLAYKAEYLRRLDARIAGRIAELQRDPAAARRHLVPGSFELLEALRQRGVIMYLASGTDDAAVQQEAELLSVSAYFAGIYGARDDYRSFSKKIVIDRIIAEHHLQGEELIGFGDGYVEIENVKGVGGFACGVASDEQSRRGIDQWKRERLKRSGADIIIPDYADTPQLMEYLFPPGS